MRCLYCGKELALLKRWTGGGEFCSDAHRQQYQEEYNQLALTRLLQAKPPGASAKTEAKPDAKVEAKGEAKVSKAEAKAEKSSPASKAPAKETPAIAAKIAAKPEPAPVIAVAPDPEPEPEIEPVPVPVAIEPEPEPELEPDPAPMSGFFLEFPAPVFVDLKAMAQSANGFEYHVQPELPSATFEEHSIHLVAPGPVEAGPRGRLAEYTAASAERKVEIREFASAKPVVQVDLSAAGDFQLPEMIEEPMELLIYPRPPQGSPPLWDQGPRSFAFETDLGILARVAFRTTGIQDNEDSADPLESLTPAPLRSFAAAAVAEPAIEIEIPAGARVLQPAEAMAEPVTVKVKTPDPLPIEKIEIEPEPVPEQPEPAMVNQPMPVTLLGLAAGRGKPVQVFSAVSARVDLHIPRSGALPLRPVMTLGPAPAAAAAPAASPARTAVPAKPAEEKKPERTVVLKAEPKKNPPGRPDPRFTNGKNRKDVKPSEPEKKDLDKKDVRKEAEKKEEAREVEQPKETVAAAVKTEKAAENAPEKTVEPAVEKVEEKPVKKDRRDTPLPAPMAAPYNPPDLGIPNLNLDAGGSFWSRLPVAGKAGLVLTFIALIGGGFYVFKGSGKTGATTAQVVEAPAITGGEAGWITDWGSEPGVRKLHDIYVMRSTLTLSDYRIEFQEQMESKALGWVYRAQDGKNYYVNRLEVVKPGLNPLIALVRYAVVNGEEQPHTQTPLNLQVHADTVYKIRFDAVANHFTTWVQDQQVDDWTDERFKVGGVGFYNERGVAAVSMRVAPLVFKK